MAKKSYTVKGMVEKAIVDSFRASKGNGLQIFVTTHPHVGLISFQAYKNGWGASKDEDFNVRIYINGILAPTSKRCKELLKPIYELINKNK